MRTRLLVIACLVVVSGGAAGCSSGSGVPSSSVRASVASTASTASATGTSLSAAPGAPTVSSASAPPASATPGSSPGCAGSQTTSSFEPGALTGLEFVSVADGWAVGQDEILATSDGGAHWRQQLAGQLNLTSVDFISAADGWAVGTTTLLATTDGGAHWAKLPEPCALIRSVHFISPSTGFAIAGGSQIAGPGPASPLHGGVVLTSSDGGRSWRAVAAPANSQTVCFNDSRDGWVGAGGQLYRTSDGGRHWMVLTSSAGAIASIGAEMTVQCAGPDAAWALRLGPGAAMSQEPHVGFHADLAGAKALFAEHYFQTPGATPTAQAPGSYAGPYSALSPSAAVFIDWCAACGDGTAPWDLATNSGATLTREGDVGDLTEPQAASFLSPEVGWVAGTFTTFKPPDTFRQQQRIVVTTDGGRSWQVQYAGPWPSSLPFSCCYLGLNDSAGR